MNARFSIVTRSRGRDGVVGVSMSAGLMVIGAVTLTVAQIFDLEVPMLGVATMGVLTFVGALFLGRYLMEIRRGREWEICVDETHIRWFERDRSTERLEGEVAIREIRRIILEPADGEPPSLVIEFNDGTRFRLPTFHLDTRKKVEAFVDYWRKAHAETPYQNLETC